MANLREPKSLARLELPRLDNRFYEENTNPSGFGTDPEDGLPRPNVMNSLKETRAVPLDPKTFVCMADPNSGRQQCKHYCRMLVPFENGSDKLTMNRFCTALKDENGEFFSIADDAVLACELRSPRDPTSELRLQEFDQKVIEEHRKANAPEETFDIEKALEE